MKQLIFRGVGTALVTPFTSDGAVDFEALGRLIDLQIAGGVGALVPCGTTGESAAMTEKERLSVIEYTVWRTNGRIPVIGGTGTNNTAQSVRLTKAARELGADGVLAVCPYYSKPTEEGVYRHYLSLAECGLPVLVYNVPSRVGISIAPGVLKRLSEHPNIAGLKDAGGNLQKTAEIRHLCGDNLPLYSGDDGTVLPTLSLGGVGVISVASNLLPRAVQSLCEKWFSGDVKGAEEMQLKLMPLISVLFAQTNPIPVKTALEVLGFSAPVFRLPLCPLTEEQKAPLFAVARDSLATLFA